MYLSPFFPIGRQQGSSDVDKRFAIFIVLSITIVIGNMALQKYLHRNDPVQPPVVENEDDGKEKEKDNGEPEKPAKAEPAKDQQPDDGKPAKDDVKPEPKDDVKPAPKDEAKPPPPKVSREQRTIGDITPGGRYRMLVTLDNRGAAIVRLELSSDKYRDLHDKSGYLGHLALEDVAGGCRVGVVGAGTPAATAQLNGTSVGLQVGDVITKVIGQPLDVTVGDEQLVGREAFQHLMAGTKPGDDIKLTVIRAGQTLKLKLTLWRRPLEVIRPEAENYAARGEELPDDEESPSLLLSLLKGGKDEEPVELASDQLRQGHWEVGALVGEKKLWQAGAQSNQHVTFRQQLLDENIVVYKTFALEPVPEEELENASHRSYHVTVSVRIDNVGPKETYVAYVLDGPNGLPTEGWWYAYKISPNWFWEWGGGGGLRDFVVDKHAGLQLVGCAVIADQIEEDELRSWPNTQVLYAGVDAQYFAAVLLPSNDAAQQEKFANVEYGCVGEIHEDRHNLSNISFRLTSAMRKLPPGDSVTDEYELFAGPKKPKLMAEYGVDSLIEYGMFSWVAQAMLWLLHHFYSVVGNYGVSIFVLTVMVRGSMYPLSRKQALSAQKMQQLAPEIKKIQAKYGKDMEKRMKAQRELWAKHKVNPMAGCLPVFLQLPIFIGLYRSLSVDIELRDASLLGDSIRWCSNLAAPDRLLDWTGWMPEFFTQGQGIFVLGPFLNILPIITITTWIVQQKMFMPPATDDQQAMQQKMMKFMMVFMGFMFFKVAAGLCLYFIASSTWSICERKLLPKPKLPQVKPEDKTDPLVERRDARKADTKTSSNGNVQARKKKRKKQGRK